MPWFTRYRLHYPSQRAPNVVALLANVVGGPAELASHESPIPPYPCCSTCHLLCRYLVSEPSNTYRTPSSSDFARSPLATCRTALEGAIGHSSRVELLHILLAGLHFAALAVGVARLEDTPVEHATETWVKAGRVEAGDGRLGLGLVASVVPRRDEGHFLVLDGAVAGGLPHGPEGRRHRREISGVVGAGGLDMSCNVRGQACHASSSGYMRCRTEPTPHWLRLWVRDVGRGPEAAVDADDKNDREGDRGRRRGDGPQLGVRRTSGEPAVGIRGNVSVNVVNEHNVLRLVRDCDICGLHRGFDVGVERVAVVEEAKVGGQVRNTRLDHLLADVTVVTDATCALYVTCVTRLWTTCSRPKAVRLPQRCQSSSS